MKSFAELFKKYRLRAEFETISAFSEALAQHGYFYDESIFSHWQKGTRVPSDRKLLLKLIEIFNERCAIQSLRDANEFLESANQGFLTEIEQELFIFSKDQTIPFQVPSEIAHFIGREKILETIKKEVIKGKILLLHGPPGVGKTALAIKLGHMLRNQYPDGVLWYKVDSSNVMDILLSIAYLFGEDISNIKDKEVRASIVRTLLSDKKLLLIFDNVTNNQTLPLLVPNSPTASIIFTSQENSLAISNSYISVSVTTFTEAETFALFKNIFNSNYLKTNSKQIKVLALKLGNLPLALQMAANYVKKSAISLEKYIEEFSDDSIDLQQMKYEDKSLLKAITINFNTLDKETQQILVTLGIFEGKDFSLEAIAYVNKLSEQKTKQGLLKLMEISFTEESSFQRYRIHPLIKVFARQQILDPVYYLRAAQYFENLLSRADEKPCMKVLRLEVDNLIYVFKKCYEVGYWDQVITLWNPIEKFLSENNEIKKLRTLTDTIDTVPSINFLQKILTAFAILLLLYWICISYYINTASLLGASFSLLFSFIPFIGGFVGILRSKSWGLLQSNIGKAVFYISMGLFSWGMGNIIWAYYNFFQNNDVPYPSFADIGFLPAYPLWVVGIYYLSKATGVKISKSKIKAKLPFLFLPIAVIILSYYFLFFQTESTFHTNSLLMMFLDVYYPAKDIIILTFAVIIFGMSVNFFGGKYKLSLCSILVGFLFLYIADFLFSYMTSSGTFYTGGISDLFFMLGFYFIVMGNLSFYLTPKRRINTPIY